MPRTLTDDLGHAVALPEVVARVVSLVPSLTEALAATCPQRLVGATDWCTHPADLEARGVARVRGTKNPDLAAVAALRPDLVVANKEENRELDVRRLRERGIPVWVTDIETVPQSVASMRRLFREALGVEDDPGWLLEAEAAWSGPVPTPPGARRRADLAGPVDGGRAADVHRRPARPLGVRGGHRGGPGRYPAVDVDGARRPAVGRPRRSCRTSRTSSPSTTDRRPSGGCRPASCRVACSPGTARRWSIRGFRWTDPERVMSPSRPSGVRERRTPP